MPHIAAKLTAWDYTLLIHYKDLRILVNTSIKATNFTNMLDEVKEVAGINGDLGVKR